MSIDLLKQVQFLSSDKLLQLEALFAEKILESICSNFSLKNKSFSFCDFISCVFGLFGIISQLNYMFDVFINDNKNNLSQEDLEKLQSNEFRYFFIVRAFHLAFMSLSSLRPKEQNPFKREEVLRILEEVQKLYNELCLSLDSEKRILLGYCIREVFGFFVFFMMSNQEVRQRMDNILDLNQKMINFEEQRSYYKHGVSLN